MNRTIRGMAGLLVALGASACANDYSLDFGGPPTQVQASPEVMFVNQGTSEELLLRLVNDRNQSVPTSWTISNVGAGIEVDFDEDYRPDWVNDNGELEPDELQVQHRYFVTANEAVGTEFTVTSQGISKVIKVNVVPSAIPATFTDNGDGTTTVTAGGQFTFSEDLALSWTGGLEARVLSIAADGKSATILVPGGATGAPSLAGAVAGYMPTIALSARPTSDPFAKPEVSSADPGDAAAIAVAAPGTTTWITGGGSFDGTDVIGAGGPIEWVTLNVTTAGTYNFSVDWIDSGGDIDTYLYTSGGAFVDGSGTSAHPEEFSAALTPGTYWLAIVDWGSHGPEAWWTVEID